MFLKKRRKTRLSLPQRREKKGSEDGGEISGGVIESEAGFQSRWRRHFCGHALGFTALAFKSPDRRTAAALKRCGSLLYSFLGGFRRRRRFLLPVSQTPPTPRTLFTPYFAFKFKLRQM